MDNRRLTWSSEYELPYESLWGKMEKICYINGFSMGMLREYIWSNYKKDTGKNFDETIIESDMKPSPFERNEFWKRYIYHPKLKFCPVCMSYGYHSVLHQYFFTDTCFLHDCELQVVDDIDFHSSFTTLTAGKNYSYLAKPPKFIDIMDAREHLFQEIQDRLCFLDSLWNIHFHRLYPWEQVYIENESSKNVLKTLAMGKMPDKPLIKISPKNLKTKSKKALASLYSKEFRLPCYSICLKELGEKKTEWKVRTDLFKGNKAVCHFTYIYVRQLYYDKLNEEGVNYAQIEDMVHGDKDIPKSLIEAVLNYLTFCCLFDTTERISINFMYGIKWSYAIKTRESPFGIKLYGLENLASHSRKKDYFFITKTLIDRIFLMVKEQLREQVNVTGAKRSRIYLNYEIRVPEYIFAEGNNMIYLYECMPD